MKKNMFLFASTLFIGSFAYSQNTTLEEYNYIKAGIITQLRTGQDVQKRGYKLSEVHEIKKDSYSFNVGILYREDGSLAGFWIWAVSHSFGNEYSLCIPLDNPELKGMYANEVNKWDAPMSRAYARALSDLLSAAMSNWIEELKKKQ